MAMTSADGAPLLLPLFPIVVQISGRNKLPNLTFTILSPSGTTLRFAAGPVADKSEETTRTALRLCLQHARDLCRVYSILGMHV